MEFGVLGVPGEAEEAGVAGVTGVTGVAGAGGGDRGVGTALNTSSFKKRQVVFVLVVSVTRGSINKSFIWTQLLQIVILTGDDFYFFFITSTS